MRLAKTTLALALGLFMALPGVGIADTTAVGSSELDAALASSVLQEDGARERVRELLARDDVQRLAEASGLDLRRADAAVATLDGKELQEVAQLAAQANDALAGGAQTITISLVAALLIVIIIILLVD
jgi:hypothetical protein